jgi:hypothetical protein
MNQNRREKIRELLKRSLSDSDELQVDRDGSIQAI